MKKTFFLFLFIAFLAGCFLGYSDLFSSRLPGEKSPSEKETHAAGRRPASSLLRRNGSSNLPLPTESSLINFLIKYEAFSPQEIRAELDRLLKREKESGSGSQALSQAIDYLAYKLGRQSPEDAKHLLDTGNQSAYLGLLDGWAETDFEGAMSYLLSHKKEWGRDACSYFERMTTTVADRDPDKALKWLSTLSPGERKRAIGCMAKYLPLLHPGEMPEFMDALDPRELSRISFTVSLNWSKSDWESFQAWADTHKGRERESLLSNAFSDLARVDLGKATEILKKAGTKDRDKMGRDVLLGMGDEKRSEGKALDWVLENRESFSDPSSMMREAMFTRDGYSELSAKVLKLPEGDLRDAALSSLLSAQSSSGLSGDYEENITRKFTGLLELAEKIGDSQKREASVQDCVEGWLSQSPEKARQWITEKSSFSSQVKQELVEECDRLQKDKEARNS